MAKKEKQENMEEKKVMDATIKSAFDAMVKIISRKIEKKEPKAKAPKYMLEDYKVLEQGLKEVIKIAKNPADYFTNKYTDSVLGKLLEVSRLTGVRYDRLLDSLMLLSVRYYRSKQVDRKMLEQEIKRLNKKIQLKAADGIVRAMGVFRLFSSPEKFVVREKAK